ncbi:protein rhiC [Roseibium marinum]|uniref:Protein rhiC n=1 Tax=Roseibium marinum TaxID=281252 RepID=A0A2S3UVL7_9HYPH|nr:protein rhiC [Roseibium marinum]POF31772.1 hypothetical protein CLV41_104342 [Roseibium marinum]
MTSRSISLACLLALGMACAVALPAAAQDDTAQAGTKPVTSGVVIRGVTLGGPRGVAGTSTGKQCDFSGEEVNQSGRMTGASVNCRPGGNLANTLAGLPARFDAYCAINAPVKSARLIQAAVPGNANHCDLSGITPKDATGQFKGAIWR